MTPAQTSQEQGNADILLWQTWYRLAIGALAVAVPALLFAAGALRLSVAGAQLFSRGIPLALLALPGAVYIAVVLVMRQELLRKRRAGQVVAALTILADTAIAFWTIFLFSEPQHYERALLVALFSLQVTHVYFGIRPALLIVAAISSAYALLHDVAGRAGVAPDWGAIALTLAIFIAGASAVIAIHGNLLRRLANLVSLFERAGDGDFSYAYDVSGEQRPDSITRVGLAYNRMRSQLSAVVLTDPLSGVLNRRGFEQQYRRELARATRSNGRLSLIAIDLDHFKNVNDTHGHLFGDHVIAETGALLRATARAGDTIARTGGEEFMLLAPDTDAGGAIHLANRLVEAFRNKNFSDGKLSARVTASAGVVSAVVSTESVAEELRALADEALYEAKRTGRDRVVFSGRHAHMAGRHDDAVPAHVNSGN